jgi:hypothetical protein
MKYGETDVETNVRCVGVADMTVNREQVNRQSVVKRW